MGDVRDRLRAEKTRAQSPSADRVPTLASQTPDSRLASARERSRLASSTEACLAQALRRHPRAATTRAGPMCDEPKQQSTCFCFRGRPASPGPSARALRKKPDGRGWSSRVSSIARLRGSQLSLLGARGQSTCGWRQWPRRHIGHRPRARRAHASASGLLSATRADRLRRCRARRCGLSLRALRNGTRR